MTQRKAYFEVLNLLVGLDSASHDPYYRTSAIALTKGMIAANPADEVLASILSDLVGGGSTSTTLDHADQDAGSEEHTGQTGTMGDDFHRLYYQSGDVQDLQKAVQLMQDFAATDPNHPELGAIFHDLADTFRERFEQLGLLGDLETAIDAAEQAVRFTPPDEPDWIARVSNLGCYYSMRFDCLGGLDDLAKAIDTNERVVAATPFDDPERGGRLCNLSYAFHSRFERLGDEEDIQMAVSASQQAVTTSTDRAAALSVLSVMLNARFARLGHTEDVDNAVQASLDAVDATLPDDPDLRGRLDTLGNTCRTRFENSGNLEDLSMAVSASTKALNATPLMHPDRANMQNNLSYHLWTRFERLGDPEDLDDAIVASEESVAITPVTHPDGAHRLSNLGQWLTTRFDRFGDMADLDRAVQASEEGIAGTPLDHPDRAGRLGNLSNCFHRRFQRVGAVDDLQRAIHANSEALALTPVDHPDRPSVLANLSHKLHSRFSRVGDPADLEAAIQASEEAIEATPPGRPILPDILDNLSHQFHSRFELAGALDDLGEAIRTAEEAVKQIPEGHPLRANVLKDLALWFRTRYERLRDLGDLEKALQASQAAVAAMHPEDPDLANTVLLFGFLLNLSGDSGRALGAALGAWNCFIAPPRIRIRAAYFAATLLAEAGRWEEASVILREAVGILPTVSPPFLSRDDHEHILAEFTKLAAFSIAASLEVQSPPAECLSLLEVGRGIIIGLTIDCRSDLSELKAINPYLANRLGDLRTAIDSPQVSLGRYADVYQPVDEERRRQRVEATNGIDETLATIRQLPGFERFQLPPSTDDLLAVAAEGPIVVFNTTQYRSDAIILTSSTITSLSLPNMSDSDVIDRMKELPGLSRGKRSTYPARNRKMQETLLWLWEVAVEPVLEELNFHAVDQSELPRIWWMGVGDLATAPFHAAGDHSRGSTRNTLSRAISSYTPTLKALSYARQKKLDLGPAPRLLLVTMATTPDTPATATVPARPRVPAIPATAAVPATLTTPSVARTYWTAAVYSTPAVPGTTAKTWKPLPNAITEAEDIIRAVQATTHQLDSPTVAAVLERLPQYHITHFACHGVSDRHNPSNSHLLLHADDLSSSGPGRLTAGAISAMHMHRAQIAYLSACCSADNAAVRLVNEGIHIASGFQLAGFSHVLATLWESNDAACRQVAREFYDGLFGSGQGGREHRVVSAAFHHAVRKLRDENVEQPIRWASFIHSGA